MCKPNYFPCYHEKENFWVVRKYAKDRSVGTVVSFLSSFSRLQIYILESTCALPLRIVHYNSSFKTPLRRKSIVCTPVLILDRGDVAMVERLHIHRYT